MTYDRWAGLYWKKQAVRRKIIDAVYNIMVKSKIKGIKSR